MRRQALQEDDVIRINIAMAVLGLQVPEVFDAKAKADVENAYRKMVRTVHPDVCKGPDAARLFTLATESRELILKLQPQFGQQPIQQTVEPMVHVTVHHGTANSSFWWT